MNRRRPRAVVSPLIRPWRDRMVGVHPWASWHAGVPDYSPAVVEGTMACRGESRRCRPAGPGPARGPQQRRWKSAAGPAAARSRRCPGARPKSHQRKSPVLERPLGSSNPPQSAGLFTSTKPGACCPASTIAARRIARPSTPASGASDSADGLRGLGGRRVRRSARIPADVRTVCEA